MFDRWIINDNEQLNVMKTTRLRCMCLNCKLANIEKSILFLKRKNYKVP